MLSHADEGNSMHAKVNEFAIERSVLMVQQRSHHEVIQAEAVVRSDEVYAVVRLAVVDLVHVRAAAQAGS
jgi:hypothetical protein